jgi:hypothetical protein
VSFTGSPAVSIAFCAGLRPGARRATGLPRKGTLLLSPYSPNLIVELAVQYARVAGKSVLATEAPAKPAGKPAKGDTVSASFFAFFKKAVEFVPEAGQLSDADLAQHMRKALSAAKRQKNDPKSKIPPERREELHLALAK